MPRTRLARPLRVAGLAAALGASLVLTGCGFDVQTLQPYTPADGVNADVKGGPLVRNLLVVADASGKGVVSASLVSNGKADALTAVSATTTKPDGSAGAPLTVTSAASAESTMISEGGPFAAVALPAGKLVVLTDATSRRIFVAGPDLKPGLTATFTLTFGSGAMHTLTAPVMDAENPTYAAIGSSLAG